MYSQKTTSDSRRISLLLSKLHSKQSLFFRIRYSRILNQTPYHYPLFIILCVFFFSSPFLFLSFPEKERNLISFQKKFAPYLDGIEYRAKGIRFKGGIIHIKKIILFPRKSDIFEKINIKNATLIYDKKSSKISSVFAEKIKVEGLKSFEPLPFLF